MESSNETTCPPWRGTTGLMIDDDDDDDDGDDNDDDDDDDDDKRLSKKEKGYMKTRIIKVIKITYFSFFVSIIT